VVGRELLMMCPDGEDHQGHDWGETEVGMVAMVHTSRGMGMVLTMNDFRILAPKMRMAFYDQIEVMLMTRMLAFIPMNFYLTDWITVMEGTCGAGVPTILIMMAWSFRRVRITTLVIHGAEKEVSTICTLRKRRIWRRELLNA